MMVWCAYLEIALRAFGSPKKFIPDEKKWGK
jgi:hypothetical protein